MSGIPFDEFLARVIEDGIAAAREDYADDRPKRRGSIAGFTLCMGKEPSQLAMLLMETHADAQEAFRKQAADYWYWRCRELEVEWVCNCASAALANMKLPTIVPPTYRGVMKAAEILGIGASED
jgi:hypothetical protein